VFFIMLSSGFLFLPPHAASAKDTIAIANIFFMAVPSVEFPF